MIDYNQELGAFVDAPHDERDSVDVEALQSEYDALFEQWSQERATLVLIDGPGGWASQAVEFAGAAMRAVHKLESKRRSLAFQLKIIEAFYKETIRIHLETIRAYQARQDNEEGNDE